MEITPIVNPVRNTVENFDRLLWPLLFSKQANFLAFHIAQITAATSTIRMFIFCWETPQPVVETVASIRELTFQASSADNYVPYITG
jgi:hypothetical protein